MSIGGRSTQVPQVGNRSCNFACLGFLSVLLVLGVLLPSSGFGVVPPWEIEGLEKLEAPAFQMMDMAGKRISDKDLRGKVVLLNFWATWCGPCRDEMPSFDKLYATFKDKGLVVLGISIDSNKGLVRNFLKKRPVAFPVAVDPDSEVAKLYKVFTYPTTFLIDRKGIVQGFYLGEQKWNDDSFIKKIENLLR